MQGVYGILQLCRALFKAEFESALFDFRHNVIYYLFMLYS